MLAGVKCNRTFDSFERLYDLVSIFVPKFVVKSFPIADDHETTLGTHLTYFLLHRVDHFTLRLLVCHKDNQKICASYLWKS